MGASPPGPGKDLIEPIQGAARSSVTPVPAHTRAEFVAFLEDLIARQAPERAIHIICDNLSGHKTKAVGDFLTRHLKA
jgi:hypothetical protein